MMHAKSLTASRLLRMFSLSYLNLVTVGSYFAGILRHTGGRLPKLLLALLFIPAVLFAWRLTDTGLCRLDSWLKRRHWQDLAAAPAAFTLHSWLPWLLPALAVSLVYYLRAFPGGFTFDSQSQWEQIQTHSFSNWHPFAQTLLLWLASRIVNRWFFVALLHTLTAAIALSLVFTSLARHGFPHRLLLAMEFFVLVNPAWEYTVIYLWKDSSLTVTVCLLLCCLIHILSSGGAWFRSRPRTLLFAGLLALATLLRHNAFFFTLPLLAALLIHYRRLRPARLLLPLVALILIVMRFGVYALFPVEYPRQTVDESVGLPMTVILSVHVVDPEAVQAEVRIFLEELSGDPAILEQMRFGDYNTVKFALAKTPSELTTPSAILSMAWRTFCARPLLGALAVWELTAFVWDATAYRPYEYPVEIVDNDFDIRPQPAVRKVGEALALPLNSIRVVLGPLFSSIGFYLLLLVLAVAVCFERLGQLALILPLAIFAYAFGTSLLLASWDYRFFFFIPVITMPLILLLMGFGFASTESQIRELC
ncbi:MAG: hypothetical protein QM270_11200 [Bacillota bacterium]|nr:hypothetical protein [Bacillota bacterium]